jgi:hypothetical protein
VRASRRTTCLNLIICSRVKKYDSRATLEKS